MSDEELGKLRERIAELEKQLTEEREEFEWDLKASKEGVANTIKTLQEENARLKQSGDTEALKQRALLAEARVIELTKEVEKARDARPVSSGPPPIPPPIPKDRPKLKRRAEIAEQERDDLAHQKKALERLLGEKEAALQQLKAQSGNAAALQGKLDEMNRQLERNNQELEQARKAAADQAGSQSTQQAQYQERIGQLEKELEEVRQAVSQTEAMNSQQTELQDRAARLESELAEKSARIGEVERELEEARQAATSQTETLNSRQTELQERTARLEKELQEARAAREEQAVETSASQTGQDEKVGQLEKQLADRNDEFVRVEVERDGLLEQLEQARVAFEQHQQDLSAMNQASQAAAAEAQSLRERVAELEDKLASQESTPAVAAVPEPESESESEPVPESAPEAVPGIAKVTSDFWQEDATNESVPEMPSQDSPPETDEAHGAATDMDQLAAMGQSVPEPVPEPVPEQEAEIPDEPVSAPALEEPFEVESVAAGAGQPPFTGDVGGDPNSEEEELEEIEPIGEASEPPPDDDDDDAAFIVSPADRSGFDRSAKSRESGLELDLPKEELAEVAGATAMARHSSAKKWIGIVIVLIVLGGLAFGVWHYYPQLFGTGKKQPGEIVKPPEPKEVVRPSSPPAEVKAPEKKPEPVESPEEEPIVEKGPPEGKEPPAKKKETAVVKKTEGKLITDAGEKTAETKAPGIKKPSSVKATEGKPRKKITQEDRELALEYLAEGEALMKARKFKGAVHEFVKALKANPRLAKAYRGLGICYAQLKQNKNACVSYRRYMKMIPPNSKEMPQLERITAGCP